MPRHRALLGARTTRRRWLLLALTLGLSALAIGAALAADPGSKEDPLATVSFVQRQAQFSRVELRAGQLLLLGSGAELVVADDAGGGVEFKGLDPLRDELIDLTKGALADSAALSPFQHYVNASAHELKLKPLRDTVLLLRGDWR